MFEEEKVIEQQHFEEVREFIKKDTVRLTALAENYRENIRAMGKKYNEDNPYGGMYSEDVQSNKELTDIHAEMQNAMILAEEAKNDLYFYRKLINEPYFARIDFTPVKTGKTKKIYIGLKTLQDPDTYDLLVCDWRAPISTLFYEDYDGEAWFDAPSGRIYGDILLKRQFRFENGELKYFIDCDLKIDDDILREVLSSQSGDKLKVIVNSIQREQNRAIRYSDSKNLLVTGPAGSGKTSVGFHRLAYLLYRNRNELKSAETVMFSNNDIFSSYVADIIPELGEMPINYASFYSVFRAEIPAYRTGDYYALADELINKSEIRKESVRIKFSDEFQEYLKITADEFVPEFSDVTLFDETVIKGETILERFLSDSEIAPLLRGERLCTFADGIIDEYFIVHNDEIRVIIDEDTDIDEDTSKAVKLKRRILKQETSRMIKDSLNFDPVVIYCKALFKYVKENGENENVSQLTAEKLKSGTLLFEDALCIVRLKQHLGTAAVIPSVKHVLIDEAQDLCILQHEIIRTMFPRASYTLLADSNQAIIPEVNTTDTDILSKLYGTNNINLNKSYRSTAPINKFALSLLPENRRYDIFERDGEDVEFIESKSVIEDVKKKLSEYSKKSANVAIITKTAETARCIYAELKEDFENLILCDNKSAELSNAPCVMNLALTKGLEFDSVIITDTDGTFCNEENRRYLYMAVTRALHRLTVVVSC